MLRPMVSGAGFFVIACNSPRWTMEQTSTPAMTITAAMAVKIAPSSISREKSGGGLDRFDMASSFARVLPDISRSFRALLCWTSQCGRTESRVLSRSCGEALRSRTSELVRGLATGAVPFEFARREPAINLN
jgi:hypothetical protein